MSEYKDSFSGASVDTTSKSIGVYKLVHLKTGKFYIGSTGDFYKRRLDHIGRLRRQVHHLEELQGLYNDDPVFKFEFYLTGRESNEQRARDLAYQHEQELLFEHANDPLMLNKTFDAISSSAMAQLESKFPEGSLARKRVEEYRKMMSERISTHRNTEHAKTKQSSDTKSQWSDPESRAKIMGGRDSKEAREANSKRNEEMWADPAYRQRMNEMRQSDEAREKLRQAIKDAGRTKRVMADGKIYDTVTEAAVALGTKRQTIKARCLNKDPKFDNYKYLD